MTAQQFFDLKANRYIADPVSGIKLRVIEPISEARGSCIRARVLDSVTITLPKRRYEAHQQHVLLRGSVILVPITAAHMYRMVAYDYIK